MGPDPNPEGDDQGQLPDNKFINESYSRDPGTFWIWLVFLAIFLAIVWGVGSEYAAYMSQRTEEKPFLQVSNRDMSVFLWQNPEFSRANAKTKTGYMPAFEYMGKITVNPAAADQWVVAPPEVLFRYHTWDRLLKSEFTIRPIPTHEFVEFLEYDEQWQPENWQRAPAGYKDFVKSLNPLSKDDLQAQPENVLPRIVRLAFQGWKNFQFEIDAINDIRPSFKEMAAFLKDHPHFARNYWQNILDGAGRQPYLKNLTKQTENSNEPIPSEQLRSTLRQAFYNYQQAKKEQ